MLFAFAENFGSLCFWPPEAVSQPRKPKFPKIHDPLNLQQARKHEIPKFLKMQNALSLCYFLARTAACASRPGAFWPIRCKVPSRTPRLTTWRSIWSHFHDFRPSPSKSTYSGLGDSIEKSFFNILFSDPSIFQ